ncbi:hypothetical protein [Azospirillum sp. B506]|uniref:hypothetical protein n=1 Tax=Azospirillum sp. B506 TaxID=137721 RepID=UPI0005B2C29A|nr:hypothetical protein [Azospirillum sp. B506]
MPISLREGLAIDDDHRALRCHPHWRERERYFAPPRVIYAPPPVVYAPPPPPRVIYAPPPVVYAPRPVAPGFGLSVNIR